MEIELDAKVVIDLVGKETSNPNSIDAIVADCGEGLKEIPFCQNQTLLQGGQQVCRHLSQTGSPPCPRFYYFYPTSPRGWIAS